MYVRYAVGMKYTDDEGERLHAKHLQEYLAKRAQLPSARITRLAAGESEFFTQYKDASQVQGIVRAVRLKTGARFKCRTERCPVFGHIEGVRVTRVA